MHLQPFKTIIFIVAGILFTSCFMPARSFGQQQVDFEELKTDTIEGVIVPADKAPAYYRSIHVDGYFTPLKDDILKAESKLIDFIEFATPESKGYPFVPDLDKKLANYKRQYVGVVLKGEKKIWLNFFCRVIGNFDWKHNPCVFYRGGGCYFNVLYSIDSGEFSKLIINSL